MNEQPLDARHITKWATVILALALIAFAYFQLSQPAIEKGNPLAVVPANAALVCTFDQLDGATDELSLFQTLLNNAGRRTSFKGWAQTLQKLDSLRTQNRKWYDWLQTCGLSFQTADALNPDNWSLSIALPSNASASDFMKDWLPDLPKREFKSASLFIGPNAAWCELNHCLIFSPSAAVLEDVVIQVDKNNVLAANDAFNASYNLRSKDVPLHLSIQIADSGWLTLEPVFTSSGTLLNGFLPQNGEQSQPIALHATPGDISIQQVLPENTTFLDVIHTSEFDTTWSSLTNYYRGSQAELFWSQAWQDLGDSCQCDLNEILLNWRTGEQGIAVIELGDSLSEALSFFGISDSSNVINLLKPVLNNQATPADGIYTVALPQAFMRNAIPSLTIENNFVMQWEGFLFSAASAQSLKAIRNGSKKLSDKNDFASFLSQSGKSSGRFVYQSNSEVALLPSSLSALIDGSGSKSFTTELSQPQQILISIAIPIRIKESAPIEAPAIPEPTAEINQSADATTTNEQSWQVINHNTQEKENLRLTKENKLELLGADGKLLWSIDIDGGPILGDVVQIDALKNGKLQMAFTTESAVYILDRNGNALPGFPYHTKPPITSPLLVADYDNTKKYRLIFAAGDGMLFNLGVDGNPTSGWKFNSTVSEKIISVKTQKIASDDVLITASDQGSVQLLKRTGETKAKCSSKLEGFDGKTLDIISGNDFSTTSIVYSCGSSAKTVQLSVE
jgi:hypothetical protein